MNIQLRLTEKMKATDIDMVGLGNKGHNLLKRLSINTIGEVVEKWNTLGKLRGMGDITRRQIQNAIVNFMISEMSDDELVEWFGYLVENNPAESLRSIYEGLNAKEVGAA